jgi:hypothetical protein
MYSRSFGILIRDHVSRRHLLKWRFVGIPSWLVLDEIAAGNLCPPGRIPGNSRTARRGPSQGFINRITDWTNDNIIIEYPDGSTNRDPDPEGS